MDELALLKSVMDKTAGLIAGVRDDQWDAATPCPEYDVRTLVGHMTGWLQVFAAAANGERFEGDPNAYRARPGAAADFEAAADRMITGWRVGGFDRSVPMTGSEQPAATVVNMTLIEYITHGWDLATATGQPMPYTDEEAADILRRAEATLPPQYRGPGKPFGDIVEVPATAPAGDRLAAFMGRRPGRTTAG